VFTALASTSYVDQSHACTFSVTGIPKFLRNSKVTVKKPGSLRCCLLSPKCSKTHLRASLNRKFLPGVIPRTPFKGAGNEREGRGGEGVQRELGRGEGWEGNRMEGKGRERKGRGGRKRGGEGMDAPGAGPPKIFELEPPLKFPLPFFPRDSFFLPNPQ
jgi:hypothetical protein